MSFPVSYCIFVCLCLIGAGGLFAFSAVRRGQLKAALTGFALALPLGYAAAKAGYLCFRLLPQLSRWGASALVLPRADSFSFVCGCAGVVLALALSARMNGVRAGDILNAFAPYGAALIACFRMAELWLGTLGAGALLPDGHWAAGTFLAIPNSWGEWHWAVSVPEAAFALFCAALALTVWKRRDDRFARTVLYLCCGQMLFELLRTNTASWHFVRTEQLWCAVVLAAFSVIAVISSRRWLPLCLTALLLALNAYLQFALDKPELLTAVLPAFLHPWTEQNIKPVCYTGFILTSVGLWLAARQSLKGIYSPSLNICTITS
ncbi:MAG: hypothetical protein II879_00365 [Clostridia bacterium]|nr:hypothetical protein [Clostridia bacterium]